MKKYHSTRSITKWKSSNGSYEHKRTKVKEIRDVVQRKAKEKTEKLIVKEYSALINKQGIDNMDVLQNSLLKFLKEDDSVDLHKALILLQAGGFKVAHGILTEMLEEENKKERKNKKLMLDIVNIYIKLLKNSNSEMRMLNAEKHDMQHGKKRINVNVDMPKLSFEDFLKGENKKIIDVEAEEVDNRGHSKDNTSPEAGD